MLYVCAPRALFPREELTQDALKRVLMEIYCISILNLSGSPLSVLEVAKEAIKKPFVIFTM